MPTDYELVDTKTLRDEFGTQVNELRTEDYQNFFDHTFARDEAPDTKNWEFTSADIAKQSSEIELQAASTTLETTQRGNYPPGTEAIPGVAWRATAVPSSGEALAGYYDDNNGFGGGEDATGSFVFIRKAGATERVYRPNWNGYVPDSRVWVSDTPVVTRMPHLFYGGGRIQIRALVHENNETTLRTLHTFTPANVPDSFGDGPPIDQPNLPVRFETVSLTGANLRANAGHYERGESDAENRVNGEHFTNVSVGSTGWTPLISWRKRAGWDMVNVAPVGVKAAAETNDVKLEMQLGSTLSATDFALPQNSSSTETAVQFDTAGTLDTNGERRWIGYVPSGQGSQSGSLLAQEIDFNLPSTRTVTLAAQAVGGTATVSGLVSLEEYF